MAEDPSEDPNSNKLDDGPELPELSPEEIDSAIAEADPNFSNAMKAIEGDKSLSAAVIEEGQTLSELEKEEQEWKSTLFGRIAIKIFPFLATYTLRLKTFRYQMLSKGKGAAGSVYTFVYYLIDDFRKKLGKAIKDSLSSLGTEITRQRAVFKKLPKKKKLSIGGIFLVGLIGITIIVLSWTKGIIPGESPLFEKSLDPLATQIYEYNPATETEPFYENLRSGVHLFHIEKVVVNIKKSKSSGTNPMASFDFYVEAATPEVLYEIKENEIRIKDQIQRTIEGFNFDQLESPEGKRDLTKTLEQELNAILVSGRVRAIRIKTAIVKP